MSENDTTIRPIDPDELAELITGSEEFALLDAREQGVFFGSHLFHASCVPLSKLELELPAVVPRLSTRVVWCDGGTEEDRLARRAAARSAELGWTDVSVLTGGTAAWAASGRELYSGVNVPSKAFGELIEHTFDTPRIPAPELHGLLEDGADVVVLDARPMDEFSRMSIPTGTDCPGAELVLRVKELTPSTDTLVVVNCAGRTRSIIGAQSLINAGLENRVVALENGTMGWELSGYDVATGITNHAPSPAAPNEAWAQAAAGRVGERFGVRQVDLQTVGEWRDDPTRTTYILDVRTPEEFLDGHVPGSRNAPGGQLVQATDEFVATRNARLVLIDDNGVRATMTASWLRQLGWSDAVVWPDALDTVSPLDVGPTPPSLPETPGGVDVDTLHRWLAESDNSTIVLDLSSSLGFRHRGHIPGAWWGVRSRLDEARARLPEGQRIVLTDSSGTVAPLAVAEAQEQWPEIEVVALAGGFAAWREAGHEVELGFEQATTTPDDVWYKPYDHEGDVVEQHMRDYLTWEIALVEQLARDETVTFPHFE